MSLTKMELAKSRIALHAGFFIALTSKLDFMEDATIPTACTNGRYVKYNPAWIETLTLPQVVGLVLHEVGHNMLAHPMRAHGFKQPQIANIAMDVVLNRKLLQYFEETRSSLNAELPPNGIFGPMWAKYDEAWSFERTYNDLLKLAEKNGSAGKQLPEQMDSVEPGSNEDGSPMTAGEMAALAKEWTMAAQQAASMAKQRGKLPGMWEEFVSDMVKPRIDWRAQIRDVFTKLAKEDVSWRRLNRRFLHSESYLPGMYSERMGRVSFLLDSSGSMGSEEFKVGLGALNEIFEEVSPDAIRFIQCDTRVVHDEVLTPDDLPIMAQPFKGRGGTELTPAFKLLQKETEESELVVMLTDGQFGAIDKALEPKCPMVWLVTTDSVEAAEASFGRVIRIEL